MNSSISIFRPVFSNLWRAFEFLCDIIDRFLQIFGVLILVGMWGLLLFNAIARWTDVSTIGWSLEITSYMVAWSIFVMMGPITRADEQIKVTFFPEKMLGPERGALFIRIAENLIGLFICTYLAYHGYILIDKTRELGLTEPSGGGWEYPMWVLRSGVMLGFAFTALYYFERSIKMIIQFITKSEEVTSGGSAFAASMPPAVVSPEPGATAEPRAENSNVPVLQDNIDKEQE